MRLPSMAFIACVLCHDPVMAQELPQTTALRALGAFDAGCMGHLTTPARTLSALGFSQGSPSRFTGTPGATAFVSMDSRLAVVFLPSVDSCRVYVSGLAVPSLLDAFRRAMSDAGATVVQEGTFDIQGSKVTNVAYRMGSRPGMARLLTASGREGPQALTILSSAPFPSGPGPSMPGR